MVQQIEIRKPLIVGADKPRYRTPPFARTACDIVEMMVKRGFTFWSSVQMRSKPLLKYLGNESGLHPGEYIITDNMFFHLKDTACLVMIELIETRAYPDEHPITTLRVATWTRGDNGVVQPRDPWAQLHLAMGHSHGQHFITQWQRVVMLRETIVEQLVPFADLILSAQTTMVRGSTYFPMFHAQPMYCSAYPTLAGRAYFSSRFNNPIFREFVGEIV